MQLIKAISFPLFSLSKVGGGEGDDEFEERFLHVFGLGEATPEKKPVTRTPSQPDENEREKLLKEQQTNSPWYDTRASAMI